MKVLVVEDDAVSRLLLIRALKRRGFDVTACASAEEAMKAYETTFFSLLFLDIAEINFPLLFRIAHL
jgi:CheY-like chemotaxis protein